MERASSPGERRGCEAVVEAAAAASSLPELLDRTLAALEEHFGYSTSAFMLALTEGALPARRAYAGRTHGSPEYVLEEYFERWADRDPLASDAGRASYHRNGRTSVSEIYPQLDEPRRRFVDDFCRRNHNQQQLSFRLAAGWTEGYLTLLGPEEYKQRDERILASLAPALTDLLRERLPRGFDAGLSVREGQVAELVALGFSNREIADVLSVEEDTVKKHVSRAMERVGVSRRSQLAVTWATGRRMGIAPGPV